MFMLSTPDMSGVDSSLRCRNCSEVNGSAEGSSSRLRSGKRVGIDMSTGCESLEGCDDIAVI